LGGFRQPGAILARTIRRQRSARGGFAARTYMMVEPFRTFGSTYAGAGSILPHNLKAAGSNPAPQRELAICIKQLRGFRQPQSAAAPRPPSAPYQQAGAKSCETLRSDARLSAMIRRFSSTFHRRRVSVRGQALPQYAAAARDETNRIHHMTPPAATRDKVRKILDTTRTTLSPRVRRACGEPSRAGFR
jgi:hypothetical protein